MRARAGLAVIVVAAVWLGAGCGGTKPEAFRIGILTDCFGPFSTLYETSVASAELPLLKRGGRLVGNKPSSGVAGAEVAGRPVELEIGCVAGNDDVIPVARRLVEEIGAQAVVGPFDPQEGMILREYARRQPATAFLIQPSAASHLTLTKPAPNVFRFAPDAAQSVAGAGSYAYRELGWRTAAIVADDIPYSWEGAAGFISEFCSLGGRIVDRAWIPFGADPAAAVPQLPPKTDGVYLGLALSPALGFLKRYAAHHDVSRRLVSTTPLLYDPRVIPLTRGVVVAGSLPVQPTAATAKYAASFAKAFPAIPAPTAIDPTAVPVPRRRRGAAGGTRPQRRQDRRASAGDAGSARARLPHGPDPSRREPPGDRPELPEPNRSRREEQACNSDGARRAERRPDLRRLPRARRSAAQPDHPACVTRPPPRWTQ